MTVTAELDFSGELWDITNEDAIDLIKRTITSSAADRMTTEQVLTHPFYQTYIDVDESGVDSKIRYEHNISNSNRRRAFLN